MPTLMVSTQLSGGSLTLTESAVAELPPKCKIEIYTTGSIGLVSEELYSIPTCLPLHPMYCFILKRDLGQSPGIDWEVLEVEIDLGVPGPLLLQ